MPSSSDTLRLSSSAHALGDEYYRLLTSSTHPTAQSELKLTKVAHAYLDGLMELRAHLASLDGDAEAISNLCSSTDRFIELVQRDIERYEKTVATAGSSRKFK
ncbi:MAG: hypothetical protein ACJ72Z_11610 [Pyrinomonadaceae bacterium]